MRAFGWGVLFAAFLVVMIGCGKGGPIKVQGMVTLDGKPVENALVTFLPVDRGVGREATGRTGPDGSFQLTTTTPNDGALAGDYKVIVQYEEGTEVPPAGNVKQAFEGAQKARQKPKKPPKYVIPAVYSDPSKTVLKQKVPPDGAVKLELQSTGK